MVLGDANQPRMGTEEIMMKPGLVTEQIRIKAQAQKRYWVD